VTNQIEVVWASGVREALTIGDEPLLVSDIGIRVSLTESGLELQSSVAGELLQIDGEDVVTKELHVGEFVIIGGVRLRCLAASHPPASSGKTPEPIGAESLPRESGAASSYAPVRARRRPRQASSSNWLAASGVSGTVLLLVLIYMKASARSVESHVEVARQQYENNDLQSALRTLTIALRDADGELQREAEALNSKIRRELSEREGDPYVELAKGELKLLKSYVDRYIGKVNRPANTVLLAGSENERPAARELIKLCDAWIEKFGPVCSNHSRGRTLAAEVSALRAAHIDAAEITLPETADDVIFSAQCLMRFRWRDYKGAIGGLDAFLEKEPNNLEILATRSRMIAEGKLWIAKMLRRVDRSINQNRMELALSELKGLQRWSVIPEWEAMVNERHDRVKDQD
jgi:hypothetical protein